MPGQGLEGFDQALLEQVAFGSLVHRAASNVEHKNLLAFDGEQHSVPGGPLAVEELVDRLVNQVVFRCQRTTCRIVRELLKRVFESPEPASCSCLPPALATPEFAQHNVTTRVNAVGIALQAAGEPRTKKAAGSALGDPTAVDLVGPGAGATWNRWRTPWRPV